MGKKLWITTGIIGALAAAYTAGGFLGVPYGVNWALKKYAEPIVGRTITTQEVKFNPFTLQFSVKGLNVQKDGEPALLSDLCKPKFCGILFSNCLLWCSTSRLTASTAP